MEEKVVQEESKKKQPFGSRDKIGYLLGDLGNDFSFQMAASYLMVFYTKVLGVTAGFVGALFLTARLVDAFTDVGMGNLCDNSRTQKDGRFRPWIRRMAVPVAIASVLMYNYLIADWAYPAKIAYVIVTYILWGSICYTGINIPYGSMASVITADAAERTSLSTYRTMGALFAGVFVGILTPMLVYVKDESENSVPSGERFLLVAILFALFAILCYFLCYRFCQERVELPQSEKKESTLLVDLKELMRDKAFLAVMAGALLSLIANLSIASLNQYLFLDYFGDTGYLAWISIVSLLATLLIAPFGGKITRKFGKKEAGTVSLFATAAIYFLIYFLHIKNPGIYLIWLFFAYAAVGYYTIVTWAFLSDVIDDYQVRTGRRKDGTVYAVYSFARKLGQALAGGIGGFALALIGYEETAKVQTEAVRESIYAISMWIPAVSFLAGGLLLLFLYPLTRERVEENQQKIRGL